MSGDKSLFISPSTEALNTYLLECRQIFENIGCIIPLVDLELYERICDKEKFSNSVMKKVL
jgi:hypothetical protein